MTTRRARNARRWVQSNRCPKGPGITHHWTQEVGFDPTSFGAVVEWWECSKCWAVQR